MDFDANEYLSYFLQDAEEHLEIMTDALLALEESPDDPEGISQLFRVAHTLKSSSAMVGLGEISEFTHHVEDFLSEVRDGNRAADQALVTALFRCFDLLRVMLNAVQDGSWEEEKATLNEETAPALAQLRGEEVAEDEPTPSVQRAESKPDTGIAEELCAAWKDRQADGSHLYEASFTLQPDTPMPAARALLILNQIDNLGEILQSVPDVRSNDVVFGEGETLTFYLAAVSTKEDVHDQLENPYIDTLSVRDITDETEGRAPLDETAIPEGGLVATIRDAWNQRVVDGSRLYWGDLRLQPDTPMPAARALLVIQQLEELGDLIRCEPDVRNEEVDIEGQKFTFYVASTIAKEGIQEQVTIPYVESCTVRDITDEVESDTPKPETGKKTATPTAKTPAKKTKAAPAQRQEVARTQTVRVEINKLDTLLELVGELVIARGRVAELGRKIEENPSLDNASNLSEAIQNQGMILSQLQEAIMEARMVPVGNVLTRFRRLVRDLSMGVKKEVALVIEGEETELDKKVIDMIGDPLTHLIRNAIDHGLETPEVREEAGKPREGRLLLAAGREGNNVTLTVGDDGQGLNVEKIKSKALERNLATEEALEKMDENSIIQMIFMPGFSTAEKVTDVSGRGVGMDVVRRTIEELGGSVVVNTKIGEGSSFIIRIPLTLAIIQALLIEVGDECYALPISDVVEMLRLGKEDITTIEGRGEVIQVRGKVIPLVRLHDALDVPTQARKSGDSRIYVALVQQSNKVIGLVVDHNRGEQEIVIKSLGSDLESSPLLAGASILGDGEVVLILDTGRVIQYALGGKVEVS